MARAAEAKRDDDIIRGIGEVLRRNGVSLPDQVRGHATETPSHDKDSFLERARFKDLAQDQGKKPEAVLQVRTTWRDKVIAARSQAQEQEGQAPGTWAARVKASRAEGASNDNAEPMPERGWAKTVEQSRAHGAGRDRPSGQQQTRQNERGGHER